MTAQPPRRAHKFTLTIHADTADDLIGCLRHIEFLLSSEQMGTSYVSGGYASGWTAEYDVDESITHDSYIESLNAYLAESGKDRPAPEGKTNV